MAVRQPHSQTPCCRKKGHVAQSSSCPTVLQTGLHAQVGQHYLADGWGQQLMTLSDFIATHIRGEQQRAQGRHERPRQRGQEQGGGVGYLAQHPLFDQVRAGGVSSTCTSHTAVSHSHGHCVLCTDWRSYLSYC